jgi:hypothetical protein
MQSEAGIVYVAKGRKFIEEALRSAASVRQVMPDVAISIATDDDAGFPAGLFDDVRLLEKSKYTPLFKIDGIQRSPFERTVFLDTDTLVIEPIHELWTLLDRFDFAYCHAPQRYTDTDFPGCNEAFPQGNTGVIACRRTPAVEALLRDWAQIYSAWQAEWLAAGHAKNMQDQPAFRQAVFQSKVNGTILPPEYNLRTIFPVFAGARAKVKILHGRDPSLARARRSINDTLGFRTRYYNSASLSRTVEKWRKKARKLTRR